MTTSGSTYRPQLHRLYASVHVESVLLREAVLSSASAEALLHTRGALSAYTLQADILRYHLNRDLCRREDVAHLVTSWREMAARLRQHTYDTWGTTPYTEEAARVLEVGAAFLAPLLEGGEFEHQLNDDGHLQHR